MRTRSVQSNFKIKSSADQELLEKPSVTISLPLMSHEKDIYVPKEKGDVEKWVATIKLNKVKGYWFQRYLGKVRTLYVFDSPL
jgi:hypothetical protein